MVRYTFTTQKLYDRTLSGKVYIYFDEKEGTETNSRIDEETQEETSETYPIWTYQRVECQEPLKKGKIVDAIIRSKYSQADVEAIMRHKLNGVDDGEFAEFNAFAEAAKVVANKILNN